MKITIKRSGGFAGIEGVLLDLDTEDLESGTAEEAKQLIGEIGTSLEATVPQEQVIGADLQHYEIQIVDGETERRLEFDDDGSDQVASVRQIVDDLRSLAQD